jgi:thiol:disulfide interchange protein
VRYLALFFFMACAPLATLRTANAQLLDDPLRSSGRVSEGIIGQFDSGSSLSLESAALKAQIAPATGDRPAVLILSAKIAAGKHTYSITQPAGGPLPTKIELEPSREYRLLGPFRAFPAPHSRVEQGPVWTGLEIQEHEGEVTWYVPIEIVAGIDPTALNIQGTVHMEVCQTGGYCEPVEKTFAAKIGDNVQLPAGIADELAQSASASSATGEKSASDVKWSNGSYQAESPPSAVKFSGHVEPSTAVPGSSAELEFTAKLPKGTRIYAHADRDSQKGTKPMLIAITQASGLIPHRATTEAPMKIDNSVPQFGVMKYHEGEVTWTVRVDVPDSAPPGDYTVEGLIGYQACEYRDDGKNVCELPHAVKFAATVKVGDTIASTPAPIRFAPGRSYPEVARLAADYAHSLSALGQSAETEPPMTAAAPPKPEAPAEDPPSLSASDQYDLNQVQIDKSANSTGHYIALAFLGGLLLNLMPCVLPVIGLKVMSFVEQAGKSRTHALALNLWFAAGITAVFLVLALLASLPKLGLGGESLGWGGQFGSTTFNVVIASVIFAMALSLLGVWEVPIPGFFGSRSVHEAASQEGPLGAFLKGIVTTILATPCTAPFMATAVAWAVTQSFTTTLIVFASLGVGMSSPYILIGVFPELLRFLPKPGAWMETFKQLSGFVLLATVVFILSYIDPTAVVPTIVLLLGIAVACWLVARTPFTAELRDRVLSWGSAAAVVLVFVAFSFGWLFRIANAPADPGWQPFSLEKLKQLAVDEGRTVLVDFSAEWCINCKFFEQTVLHTNPVEQAISRANVVTMYADYTDYPEEIRRTINALGANGVPVIAIFPGNAPYKPIVFGGGYTKDKLIAALQRATERRGQSTAAVAEASLTPMN